MSDKGQEAAERQEIEWWKDLGDLQNRRLPGDGSYKWIKGERRADGRFYGQKKLDGRYGYEVEYHAGPKDVEWFCQIDCNYLSRIEREGILQAKEPAVWALRELDRTRGKNVDDISIWWRGYIFPNGPNGKFYDDKVLGKLLDMALSIYIGKLLVADIVRCLPRGTKNFELGLLNIVRGYLGLQVIMPDVRRSFRPSWAAARVSPSRNGLFSPEYYEKKDQETERAAEAEQAKSSSFRPE